MYFKVNSLSLAAGFLFIHAIGARTLPSALDSRPEYHARLTCISDKSTLPNTQQRPLVDNSQNRKGHSHAGSAQTSYRDPDPSKASWSGNPPWSYSGKFGPFGTFSNGVRAQLHGSSDVPDQPNLWHGLDGYSGKFGPFFLFPAVSVLNFMGLHSSDVLYSTSVLWYIFEDFRSPCFLIRLTVAELRYGWNVVNMILFFLTLSNLSHPLQLSTWTICLLAMPKVLAVRQQDKLAKSASVRARWFIVAFIAYAAIHRSIWLRWKAVLADSHMLSLPIHCQM